MITRKIRRNSWYYWKDIDRGIIRTIKGSLLFCQFRFNNESKDTITFNPRKDMIRKRPKGYKFNMERDFFRSV